MIVDCVKGVEVFADKGIVDLDNRKINITSEIKLDIDQLPMINLEGKNIIRFAQVGMKYFIVLEDYENKMIFAYIITQKIEKEKMEIESIYTSTKPFNDNVLKDFFRYKKAFEMENLKLRLDFILSNIKIIPEYEKEYFLEKVENYLEGKIEEKTEKEKLSIAELTKIEKKFMGISSKLVQLPLKYNGKEYNTVGQFCKEYGIPNASFYDQYVHRKKSLNEIVEKYKNGKRPEKIKHFYEYLGKKMSVKELSELSGLNRRIIYNRLSNGWTVEEAVETPELKRGEKR